MAKISTESKKDLFTHIGIIVCLFIAFFLAFFFVYLPWSTNHGQSITVPKLDNMKLSKLEDFLDDNNLRMEVSDCVFVAGAEPLTVKSYFPKEGSKVKEGRKIYVTIFSENAPLIHMPKITDLSLTSAQTQIIQVGLEKGQITFKPDLAENTVIEQLFNGAKIEPGTLLPKGSKIDLVVGNGKEQIPIPSVIGMDLEAAEIVINGSNLQIGNVSYDEKSSKPAGTIIKQNPDKSEGTTIEDSLIDLVIAGPDPDRQ